MKYIYETRSVLDSNITKLAKLFNNPNKIYYVSGSFGDHAVFGAYSRELQPPVNIICKEKYISFLKVFRPDAIFYPADGIVGILDTYFTHSSSWLYDNECQIIPTLPVFYPVVANLIDDYPVLAFNDFFKYLLRLPLSTKITPIQDIENLASEFKKRLRIKLSSVNDYILISPQTNTLKSLSIDFWRKCIQQIVQFEDVLLNASPEFLSDLGDIKRMNSIQLEPFEMFPAVQAAKYSLFGPSGFYHFSRYLCIQKKIGVVSNWMGLDHVLGANEQTRYPITFQETIFNEVENCKTDFFRLKSEDQHHSLIEKVCLKIKEAL